MRPQTAHTDTDPRWWNGVLVDRLYDLLVVHGTYRLLWECDHRYIEALYRQAVTDGMTVLEVGPGTGRHLARLAQARNLALDVRLLDRFPGPLGASARRLAQHKPTTYQANALDPWPLGDDSVDLAIVSMVLHCVPGQDLHAKARLFAEQARVVRPGGQVIGATVPAQGLRHTRRGRFGLRLLNGKRVFHNTGDTLGDLKALLTEHFDEVQVTTRGSVALWRGKVR